MHLALQPTPQANRLQRWRSTAGRGRDNHGPAASEPDSVEGAGCTENHLSGVTLALLRQLAAASCAPKLLGVGAPWINSPRQTQKHQQRSVETQQVIIAELANPLSEPAPGNGDDLINHQVTGLVQAVI